MVTEQIKAYCASLGLDTIGFVPCRPFDELEDFYKKRLDEHTQNEFETQDLAKRLNPHHYMEDGQTIISIAFPYSDVEPTGTNPNGFSIYTQRADYHRVVQHYLDKVCDFIRTLGGEAIGLVDSNTLPERYIAYLAGLGFIGKNNMLITEKYGSYVFLGEIITNIEMHCEEQGTFDAISHYSACGTCTNCITCCPTKSIHPAQNNPNRCLSYLTQKKVLSDKEISMLKGNVFGCDFCQYGCPLNKHKTKTPLKDFEVLSYMEEDTGVFAQMNNSYFKEKIAKTSCGWRGKNVIKRNAIIALHHKGQPIEDYRSESPYLNAYIDRLQVLGNGNERVKK